jgi:hypothetical protein
MSIDITYKIFFKEFLKEVQLCRPRRTAHSGAARRKALGLAGIAQPPGLAYSR